MARVAIVSMGWTGFKPSVEELSFREMMFEAASRAYEAAGVDPRRDVDAFVSCQEDFWEGIAITDEFAPEPIGGVLRPTFTVAGDFMQGVAQAYMLVKTGYFDLVAVESHAKPSDIGSLQGVYEMGLDPIYLRPLRVPNIHFLGGLMATSYMARTGVDRWYYAAVAAKNKANGLYNPRASHAARITVSDILSEEPVVYPLTRYEIAPFSDAAIVALVASEEAARRLTDKPVWIDGIGWATQAGTGALAWHEWDGMLSFRIAAEMAYSQAGVGNPLRDTDFAEVEDRYSFMELLVLEELGFGDPYEISTMLDKGDFDRDGYYPVNPSGGSLAAGVALEATGAYRLLEAYERLVREGDDLDSGRALVASWRGPPTATAMVAVLSSG